MGSTVATDEETEPSRVDEISGESRLSCAKRRKKTWGSGEGISWYATGLDSWGRPCGVEGRYFTPSYNIYCVFMLSHPCIYRMFHG